MHLEVLYILFKQTHPAVFWYVTSVLVAVLKPRIVNKKGLGVEILISVLSLGFPYVISGLTRIVWLF